MGLKPIRDGWDWGKDRIGTTLVIAMEERGWAQIGRVLTAGAGQIEEETVSDEKTKFEKKQCLVYVGTFW